MLFLVFGNKLCDAVQSQYVAASVHQISQLQLGFSVLNVEGRIKNLFDIVNLLAERVHALFASHGSCVVEEGFPRTNR